MGEVRSRLGVRLREFLGRRAVALVLLAICVPLQAEVQLDTNHMWRRASGISSGQQVLDFKTSQQKTGSRFSDSGETEELGTGFDQKITWGQILKNENATGQASLRNYMNEHGVNETDMAAVSKYQVQRDDLTFDFNWAYGLMDRWMIGFDVPVTYRTVRVRQDVEVSPSYTRGATAAHLVGKNATAQDVKARVRELAQKQLESSGYDGVPTRQTSWNWDDIGIMSQEVLVRSYNWSWGIQEMVRFPTAQNLATDDYLRFASDSGQTDLGITSLLDYRRAYWLAGLRFGYVFQLPDTVRMHAPSTEGALDSRVDPLVKRDLGDWFWSAIDTEISLSHRVGINGEHAFLSKQRDSYSGISSTGLPYDIYGDGTDQQLQQSRIGMTYRIGPSSMRSGILSRWVAGADYTYPWIGKNSLQASRASVELTTYF
jgi:hypothetical protein